MQATAYGFNCISVSKGTFDNTDPMTLNAVLGHEISHTLHLDAEFSRAVFATILLACGTISVMSFVFMVIIFLIFFVCSLFRSWLGVMAFKGTTKVVGGMFQLFQKGLVVIYRTVAGCVNRAAEFRCDRYAAQLGYGVQLAHFLSYAVADDPAPDDDYRGSLSFTSIYRKACGAPGIFLRDETRSCDQIEGRNTMIQQ